MTLKRSDIIFVAAAVAAYVWLFGRIIPSGHFAYDDSDYMYAVSKGLRANYLDEPTISIATFISKGLQEVRGQVSGASLSEFIRDSDDINFYRHYHAPLSFYWLMACQEILGDREDLMRWPGNFCLLLTAIVIYFGCSSLWGEHGRTGAIIAASLYLLSPTEIMTAEYVGPHGLYVLLSISTLFSVAWLLQSGDVKHLYHAAVLLCLATLTLEYAPLLAAALVACLAIRRKALTAGRPRDEIIRHLVRAALLFLLVFVFAWPAGLFKLSILKDYTFFAYFALKRSPAYGTDPFYRVWWGRVLESPVEYLLILAALAWYAVAWVRRRREAWALPFLIYSALLFATTLRNKSTSPTYVSSLLPPLHILAGAAAGRCAGSLIGRRMVVAIAVIASALASNYVNFLSVRGSSARRSPADLVVDHYRESQPGSRRILVPMGMIPPLHYYIPQGKFIPYRDDGERQMSLEALAKFDVDEAVFVDDGGQGGGSESVPRGWSLVDSLGPIDGGGFVTVYSTRSGRGLRGKDDENPESDRHPMQPMIPAG